MEPPAAADPAGDPVAFPPREGGGAGFLVAVAVGTAAGFLVVAPLAFAPVDEATPDLAFIPPGATPGDTTWPTPAPS